jgi:cytosol alanyl aminopeptidase
MNLRLPILLLAAVLTGACGAEPLPPAAPPPAPAPAAAATPPEAPLPPELRLPHTASPARYAASLTIVPGQPTFEGVVDIDLKVNEPARVLWLDGTALTVTEAHVDAIGKAFPAHAVTGGEDFVGFVFDEPLPVGPARLHVAYRGKISDKDDRGLFVEDEEGTPYVFSQFESIDARRAFPCFDEPSYKVPWQLSLHVREQDTALSNTTVASQTREAGGMKLVRFEETKPLPSYLVAFAVGPFDLVDAGKAGKKGTPVRIAVPHGQAAQAAYAAATAPTLIARIEDLLGVPYPYDKLDMVAVPRLVTFGAMENAGMITFARHLLVAKPEESTLSFKLRFAAVATHELGHHWFGDLVTTAWWDDIWLNEAFASWIEAKILVPWKPEWHYELSRARSTAGAMSGDSLLSARFIRQPIGSNDDIQNAFDEITYSKGSAVIGMWEAYLGPERFRAGLRRYLVSRAHNTATAADLLEAISAEAGRDVAPAFSTFLDQPGVPLVSAALECSTEPGAPRAAVLLSQQRYLPAGADVAPPASWQIPVCVRWGQGKTEGRACTLLGERSATLPLPEAKGCPDWMVANDGSAGYYHTAYPTSGLTALLKSGKLSLLERAGVLRDLRALVEGGRLPLADALARLPEILREPHPQILRGAIDLVWSIRDPMIPAAERPRFAHFVEKTFGARARAIGWKPSPKDDEQVRLIRPALLSLVADRGEDRALATEAEALGRRWLDDPSAVEDDLIDAVLSVTAQHGDRALFDRLRAEAKKTKDDNRRRHLLAAMTEFRDPAIVKAALGIVLTDEHDIRDATKLLDQDARMNEITYGFVKQSFDGLVTRLPSDFVGRLPGVAGAFCDEGHRSDVDAFFKDRVGKLLGGPRTLAKVLERIRVCSVQRRAQEGSLTSFLARF